MPGRTTRHPWNNSPKTDVALLAWPFAYRAESLKDAQAEGLIKSIELFQDKFGLLAYPQFGTFLGIVREQNFIDSDHDIDICYLSSKHTLPEIISEACTIYTGLKDAGLLCKYWSHIPTQHGAAPRFPPFQGGIQAPIGQAMWWMDGYGTHIDMFTSWIDEKGDYWTCQWGNFGPATQFFPLVPGTLRGKTIMIPNNADIILTRLYGDWRTPRKDHPSKYLTRGRYLWPGWKPQPEVTARQWKRKKVEP